MEGLDSLETYITVFQETRGVVLQHLTLKKSYNSPSEVLNLLLETRWVGSVIGLFLCNTYFGSFRRFPWQGSGVFVSVYQLQIACVEATLFQFLLQGRLPTKHLYTLRRQLKEQNTQLDECLGRFTAVINEARCQWHAMRAYGRVELNILLFVISKMLISFTPRPLSLSRMKSLYFLSEPPPSYCGWRDVPLLLKV